jgi:hypothetical protein
MSRMMLTDCTPEAAKTATEKEDNPARHMDKSGQGPKRAVAKAGALPLRIQPDIHNTEDSSSKRPVARVMQLYKAAPSAQCCGGILCCRAKVIS